MCEHDSTPAEIEENHLQDDAQFAALLHATMGAADPRELAKWDTAICGECRQGEYVLTQSRRKGDITVEKHVCSRCDVYGSTVVVAKPGPEPAEVWTAGDVRSVDLGLEENADARGTC